MSSQPRRISIFGATGSVGRSTLDLVRLHPERYQVVALTANGQAEELAQLAHEFSAEIAVVADEEALPALQAALKQAAPDADIACAGGEDALVDAARINADWTMAAIVGCAGLAPTMASLEQGNCVALANKEALVSAGSLMIEAAARSGATLLPVDSEHNAIFQCLQGGRVDQVRRIILTASGGPFRGCSRDDLMAVSPAQAVAHPNWSMGAKISVDSATMMNKGLELIEAHHLFPVGLDKLSIIVHPQSVIHSMVEYHDCSTLAQLGAPDMKIPIASALAWPERMDTGCRALNLTETGRLDFFEPDEQLFPATAMARAAISEGGAMPAILNAANEVAVAAFLDRQLPFLAITDCSQMVLDSFSPAPPLSIADVLAIDYEARIIARQMLKRIKG